METTTISISKLTRDRLNEFKLSGETFDDTLNRLYESACKRQLEDFLMDDKDCLSIDDAIALVKNG